MHELINIILTPYIEKSLFLINHRRLVGGNLFRHQGASLYILLDYKIIEPIILKAAVIHDILEKDRDFNENEIRNLDNDGPKVLSLVKEVTKSQYESKQKYLERLLKTGSHSAKLLKCADRISNLTDINSDLKSSFVKKYIKESIEYILPMAKEINSNMYIEIRDLITQKAKDTGVDIDAL